MRDRPEVPVSDFKVVCGRPAMCTGRTALTSCKHTVFIWVAIDRGGAAAA